MNIFVAIPKGIVRDTFLTEENVRFLESLGNVKWNDRGRNCTPEEFADGLVDMDVCVGCWGLCKFDEKVLAKANRLKLVAYVGGSVNYFVTDEMYARAEEMGYTLNEILTMASIIQMEAGTRTEAMADVAAVFYNRLNSDEFATLGSSPTCYYGYSFRKDDQRYDTYEIEGLPPGPLCSPGIAAINAALYPSENSYYYFVTDTDGKFYFHKTLSEQNATIARLKNEGKWAYETFK